jgi:hypothetical protein
MGMITKKCVALILSLGLVAGFAQADVLTLSNGGKFDGSLQKVVFLSEGKQHTYDAAQIDAQLELADEENAEDALTLKSGESLKGHLVSIKFRTIGGVQEFKRGDIKTLSLKAGPLDAARKELAEKKAEVAKDDAKGLLELAKWCRDKGLTRESRQYAAACIGAKPDDDTKTAANELLGRKTTSGDVPRPEKPKVTPEEIAALKATFAKNEGLYKSYTAKVNEMKPAEAAELKSKYDGKKTEILSRMKKLVSQIKKKEATRKKREDDMERQLKASLSKYKGMSGYSKMYNQLKSQHKVEHKDGLEENKTEYKKLRSTAKKLARVIKSAGKKASKRARERLSKVQLLRNKCKRLLLVGKNVDHDKLEAAYEASMKLDG